MMINPKKQIYTRILFSDYNASICIIDSNRINLLIYTFADLLIVNTGGSWIIPEFIDKYSFALAQEQDPNFADAHVGHIPGHCSA